ncbi:MAG: YbaK/EbsC family protein [Evtepia gabavorous]
MKPLHPPRFLPLILAAAACGLAALCLWQVLQLKSQLKDTTLSQAEQLSAMDATLQALPHQMEDALHTQASLLANYDWHYGDLNPETGTLPVTFTAVPKEQTASVTTATLVCNGKSYPMEAQDTGSFTVTVEVPLLQSLAFQQVILAEGPQQRIEALDLQEAAGTEELLHPWITLDTTASLENDQLVYEDGSLSIAQMTPGQVQSVTMVAAVDGKEVGKTPIPWEDVPEGSEAYFPFDTAYPAASGRVFTLSAEVVDSYGLRYVILVDQLSLQPDSGSAVSTPEDGPRRRLHESLLPQEACSGKDEWTPFHTNTTERRKSPMSIAAVRDYFAQFGMADNVLEFSTSSATVELAAQAAGVIPARIAKSLSFKVDGKAILIITAGDAKVDNAKFKNAFHTKAKMLTPEGGGPGEPCRGGVTLVSRKMWQSIWTAP